MLRLLRSLRLSRFPDTCPNCVTGGSPPFLRSKKKMIRTRPLITITDQTITPAFICAQFVQDIHHTDCPVCFDTLRELTMFSCRKHAVCNACKPRISRCPLCRASEFQFVPLYVPIDNVKRAMGDTIVDFGLSRIRQGFNALRPVNSLLSVQQRVALNVLRSAIFDDTCEWHDLWRFKQLTAHLNHPDIAIKGWKDFIGVLVHERLRLTETLPEHIDLMSMATPVEMRMP